jgi:membrane protein implicated in regulation of membrane protease activity
LAGFFALLLAVALLVEIPLNYSPVALGAFLVVAAFCLWRAVRRARQQREGCSSQPLSREEIRKARSKLLGNQNMRKPGGV